MEVLRLLLLFLKGYCLAENQTWGRYHQNDYDVIMERAEVLSYDHLYARDVKLAYVFLNRTQKAVNASAYMLMDINQNFKTDIQFYKFMSNEYRYFPVSFSLNMCAEYNRNSFNMQEVLNRTTNFNHGCPWKKGFYFMRNYVPDFSQLPPYIPRGAYKALVRGSFGSKVVVELAAYGSVIDKPIKWN